mmetsp:Transcript_24531/g.24804  ORF Transcript_24531/g.24804 Transcript_24531/m.24804 type:complete len:87 (-) Transcript_24531:28-288(-)
MEQDQHTTLNEDAAPPTIHSSRNPACSTQKETADRLVGRVVIQIVLSLPFERKEEREREKELVSSLFFSSIELMHLGYYTSSTRTI